MASEAPASPDLITALVTDGARLALTLGPARAWDGAPDTLLAPLQLPHAPAANNAGREVALAVGARVLGRRLTPVATSWVYGPSARRAMDREPAMAGAPFLRYDRFDVPEDASEGASSAPRRVPVRVYLARADAAGHGGAMDVLWLAPVALRAALGGIWLAELLALEGVTLTPAADTRRAWSPERTLVYTPAVAGERHVLRACAKYGDAILFPPAQAQPGES